MSTPPITATYLVETALPPEQAAEMIAGEQSSGTFVKVPGETEELKARSRARVLTIEPINETGQPALPGSLAPKTGATPIHYRRSIIRIAFPFDNIGPNLPTILATICGTLFELREVSGLKLLDVELPDAFRQNHPGPQFGVDGTRKLTGVSNRPIIGTIIKPSVGLSPVQTAALVRELGQADIDFVKDDELMANPPHSPLQDRVTAVMREVNRLADKNGRKIMYAVNISDEIDAMKRHHDWIAQAGGTCLMVSLNHVGFTGVSALRKFSSLPIHGHRNGWGMWTRHPALGMEFAAYQKLWRLAGVDHLHVNGIANKFWEPDDSVVRSIEALRQPFLGGYHALPVISSGQWGGQAPETYRLTKTIDVMYLAGGGIMAHPSGPAAGVTAIRQAWEAAVNQIPLEDYAKDHPELKQSLQKYTRKD